MEILSAQVAAEIAALPSDMYARLARLIRIIEAYGLPALPRNSVRHLDGKLWELRVTGRDGISRAIYVTASGQRVVTLRAFVKKTQKTPLRELEIARQRAKEVR
ncbi:MAG: type II toxin-antitoxin system RelE/ParE family toxin [Pseudolabrys sp.]